MAAYILIFLAVGVMAVDQPLHPHQEDVEVVPGYFSSISVEQEPVRLHQQEKDVASVKSSNVKANQLPLKLEGHLKNNMFVRNSSGCDFPFQEIGQGCYFLSEDQLNFNDAKDYCASLAHGHAYEVSLVMLEYDENEDRLILEAATTRQSAFWVGGKNNFGIKWKWLDNREMYLQAPIWYIGEPNEAENRCAVSNVSSNGNNVRSYLYDNDCSESLNFICQTGYFDFRMIEGQFYFMSEELGLPHTSWQNARDYCMSLVVPVGFHSDLAVLGLPDQNSYHVMNTFFVGYDYETAWVGAYTDSGCDYNWVDGRSLPISSQYWQFDDPDCGDQNRVALYSDTALNRTYLADVIPAQNFPFICQIFKDELFMSTLSTSHPMYTTTTRWFGA